MLHATWAQKPGSLYAFSQLPPQTYQGSKVQARQGDQSRARQYKTARHRLGSFGQARITTCAIQASPAEEEPKASLLLEMILKTIINRTLETIRIQTVEYHRVSNRGVL